MSKRQTIDQIQAGWDNFQRPKDGQLFQHYTSGDYEIIATCFLEDREEPCVAYRSLLKNIVWVRTAENFLELIKHDGQMIPRFKSL